MSCDRHRTIYATYASDRAIRCSREAIRFIVRLRVEPWRYSAIVGTFPRGERWRPSGREKRRTLQCNRMKHFSRTCYANERLGSSLQGTIS